MTPHEISFLFHCNHILSEFPGRNAPIMPETVARMQNLHLIEANPSYGERDRRTHITTDRGRRMVKSLCATALPPRVAKADSPEC